MCGVFGYIGVPRKNLSGYIIDGLTKLEYRGYDSAGVAVFENGKPHVVRATGEIINLKNKMIGQKMDGYMGIGHTRWATHGGVTEGNAHPHMDCKDELVVVHNGIIENHDELRKMLIKRGHTFKSPVDTEVFAHLVEENKKKYKTLEESVRMSFNMLHGLNAVVVISKDKKIVAFRKGSPLIAGKGRRGNFVSSDIPALISETKDIIFLEEDEGIILEAKKATKVNAKTGVKTDAKSEKVTMDNITEDLGRFDYYLMKEIFEQPEVIERIANYDKKEIEVAAKLINDAWGVYLTACGTAAHASLAGQYLLGRIAKKHVNFSYASEFSAVEDFLTTGGLVIAASQSGETMDLLEAVRYAINKGTKVLSFVNVPKSSLARISDSSLLLKGGPERAVLSTKAYIAKVSIFLLISYEIAGKFEEGVKILKAASKKISELLKSGVDKKIKKLASKLVNNEHIYIIGRGANYPTALEGALKIKEASYIHAEGFAGGELKHGVIALIEKGTPCIAIVANDETEESILSNAMELKSRGAYVIGIAPRNNPVFDFHIKVPSIKEVSQLVNIVPMQLLAYHLTTLKGLNPDKPRNLAKSVTVK